MDEFIVLCAALLLLGMLAQGLITLTFRHPVVVTVQMEKSQHDYANRGKMPVEPGSSAMLKSAKAEARREPLQTQTDGTFVKNRHHFAIFWMMGKLCTTRLQIVQAGMPPELSLSRRYYHVVCAAQSRMQIPQFTSPRIATSIILWIASMCSRRIPISMV